MGAPGRQAWGGKEDICACRRSTSMIECQRAPNELVPRVVYGEMRTVLSVVAVIAVLVGVAVVLSGCPKEQPPPDATPAAPEPDDAVAPEGEEAEVEEGVEAEEGEEGEEIEDEGEEEIEEGEVEDTEAEGEMEEEETEEETAAEEEETE